MACFFCNFRPSSHSDSYTVLATIKNSAASKRAKQEAVKMIRHEMGKGYCDWDLMHAESRNDKLMVTIYANEFPQAFVEYLKKLKNVRKIYTCESDYLRVTLSLPRGTSIATAPLVLPSEQTAVLSYLLQNSHVTMIQTRKQQKIRLIYTKYAYHNRKKHLIMLLGPLGVVVGLSLKWRNWHVSRVPDNIREIRTKLMFKRNNTSNGGKVHGKNSR